MDTDIINNRFGKLTVLKDIYIKGKNRKYICQCDCGIKIETTKQYLVSGQKTQCNHCLYNSLRHSYQYIYDYFKDQGCELLEDKYVNANCPMRYKCICGVTSRIRFSSFRNGNRCKTCGYKKVSEKQTGSRNHRFSNDREKIAQHSKFRIICKNLVNRSLRNIYDCKNTKTYSLLGYTAKDLIEHIENHPNWPKVRNYSWSIDHIFPIKAFIDYGIKDLSIINCLDNLQPILLKENCRKKDKYNKKDFEGFLDSKGIK